ncbi:MAG: helix-turn-helix domain-containing protein [Megasphaera sp.]|jgi:hypothetical protein|nr:helix-turn-helix domain-containing protein [Megasphaera sp.]
MDTITFDAPLNPKQVAKEFFYGKLSYYSVLSMAKSGEMPFHCIRGKYLIWPKELQKWLDAQGKKDVS